MEPAKQVENIVRRCQKGQRAAFEELFAIYQPRLKYFVRRLDGSGNTDDLLQDIWLTVFRKIKKLKQVASFDVWLYRIARNKVYDGFRRKDRFISLSEENDIPISEIDEPVLNLNDVGTLHRAMNELKPHHKEVLTLCFIEQMTYESIAEVVGCNIGTVRSRIFYAKQSLRKEMERNNG